MVASQQYLHLLSIVERSFRSSKYSIVVRLNDDQLLHGVFTFLPRGTGLAHALKSKGRLSRDVFRLGRLPLPLHFFGSLPARLSSLNGLD